MILLTFFYTLLSTLIIGYLSFNEAKEQQDGLLIEIGKLIENKNIVLQNHLNINENIDSENDEAVIIYDLNSEKLPIKFKKLINQPSGIYSLIFEKTEWRVKISMGSDSNNYHFFVAQQTAARNEYAWNNCISFTVPTFILLLFLIGTVSYLINFHFGPLEKLGNQISNKKPTELEPISEEGVFVELLPFFRSINALLERSKEYMTNQNLFIANAAHELRTPITAISLQVENLLNSNPDEKLERQAYITVGLTRLRKMVTQLLDLAQIGKQGVIQYEKASFLNIIKNVVSDLYPLIEQKRLSLNVCAPKDLSIYNYLGELDCLVKNAIENAIKFSAEDGKVEINLSENLKYATLVVENFNVTIPDSQMEKLTEPFFKVNQEKEGSGLGLSICYKIAKKMNGNLVLEKTTYQSFKFIYSQSLVSMKKS